tara:strand:- start:63 stop:800 length:738 start_codon:yes stop_codon:yes gene_type:complete
MEPEDITAAYAEIKEKWTKNLEPKGVKLPSHLKKDKPTKNAIVLAFLYRKMGNIVTKSELTTWVEKVTGETVNDVQQARHLAKQGGFNILSKTRGDIGTEDWNDNDGYMLVNLTDTYEGWKPKHTGKLTEEVWKQIREEWTDEKGCRCSTCGSREGKPNLRNRKVITKIQQGHMDPDKDLDATNCIPQCQQCNRPSRNWFTFDDNGRPHALADGKIITRSSREVQRDAVKAILRKNPDILSELED